MKKLLCVLGVVATLVVASVPAPKLFASTTDFWGFKIGGWQKYPNPVLPVRPGEWDSVRTREISPVINDSDGLLARGTGGQLSAYYFGSGGSPEVYQVGKATSSDNGYTWNNRTVAIAPSGVPGSWYEHDIWSPTVIKRTSDDTLFMMALGRQNDTNWETSAMGALSSTDGGTTWIDHGVQITKSMFHYENGDPITEFGVPRVIKRSSGDYLLTLEGQTTGTANWRIFAATSTTLVGGWVPLNNGNPILLPTTASWENVGVANPQVIEVAPNSYIMAYNGRGNDALGAWRVGFASSADLINWYRSPGNPLLLPGTNGFDNYFVETSFLAKADSYGVAKLYYQGYNQTNAMPQVGLATADWNEFSSLFMGNDNKLYSRRLDGALQGIGLPTGMADSKWEQIGSDWNQFPIIFNGMTDGRIYAVRSDGALLWNKYINGSGWVGWTQIGSGWDQFSQVFMGIDGKIYAVRNDGVFLRNKYIDGVGWQGWEQIGSDWSQFTHIFMNMDGWIYATRSDGALFRNKYVDGSGWVGWTQIGSGWDQFTHVFTGGNTDPWIYAKRSDGRLFKNKYVTGSGWAGWLDQ